MILANSKREYDNQRINVKCLEGGRWQKFRSFRGWRKM